MKLSKKQMEYLDTISHNVHHYMIDYIYTPTNLSSFIDGSVITNGSITDLVRMLWFRMDSSVERSVMSVLRPTEIFVKNAVNNHEII